MGITPEQFFTKNSKWIIMGLTVLFLMFAVKTCNRNMTIRGLNTEITNLGDSLKLEYKTDIGIANDSIEDLNYQVNDLEFQVKLAEGKATSADKRANETRNNSRLAMEMAGKIKTNTTIEVKGVEQVVDSTEIKQVIDSTKVKK